MKYLAFVFSFLILGIGGNCFADILREKIKEGNSLYHQEQFEPAQEVYQEVPEEDAGSPFLKYNIGNTLFQQQKYSEAIDQFKQVYSTDHPEINRASQFNIGCAQYRMAEQELDQQNLQGAMEHLKSAVETYKYAMRNFPADEDLKYNYSQAYRKLKELEEQQQQEQNQDQQNQDQDEQNEEEQEQNEDQQSEDQEQQNQQQDENESSENQEQSDQQQDQSEEQQGNQQESEQQNSDDQEQAEQSEEQQISEEEMKEAQQEMARQILEGLFDEDQMQLMDRLYKPAKRPGKFNKDW